MLLKKKKKNLRKMWSLLLFPGLVASLSSTSIVSRLMSDNLSVERRLELLEALPESSGHAYAGAKRPLVVPLGGLTCHVLPAGSVLRAWDCPSRVLGGRVRLVAQTEGRCACYGGSVCPRANCEWRIERDETVVHGRSRPFEGQHYDIIAEELSLVLDAGSQRPVSGALRVAPIPGPVAAAKKLWGGSEDIEDVPAAAAETAPPRTTPRAMPRLDDGAALGVAGVDDVLAELETRLRLPLAAPPDLLAELGVAPIRGVIFHGSPGCGKTLLATKIAHALDSDPVIVAAPQLLDRYLGGSEEKIRNAFFGDEEDDTEEESPSSVRCVVVDEIDAIASRRSDTGSPSGAERARDSIVNQLLSIMDGTATEDTFVVLATTNRLDLIDAALLRPGRFEIAIEVTPPDKRGRRSILQLHTRTARQHNRLTDRAQAAIESDFSDSYFPDGTTGATIAAVVRLAASFALQRFFSSLSDDDDASSDRRHHSDVQIDLPDFVNAVDRVIFKSSSST